MALLNQLNAASFRGVSFLLDDDEMEIGRKLAVHEYPNKNTRYVEDLGGLPPMIKIKGVITEPNYFIKLNALITALSTKGPGTLIHPFWGTLQVTPEPSKILQSMKRLGEATIEMSFLVSTPNIFPSFSGDNAGLINQLAQQMLAGTSGSFANSWDVGNRFKFNFQNAQQILGALSSTFSGVVDPFSSSSAGKSGFNLTLDQFNNAVNTNISNPTQLGSSLTTLFTGINNLTQNSQQQFSIASQFFGYGADVQLPQPTTFKRIQLIANNKILYSLVNAESLTNAYNAAALIDFADESDLDFVEDQLDSQFYYTVDNSTLDDNVLSILKNLRNQVRFKFDQERLDIRQIVNITTQPTTLTTLTYAYYGNLDNDYLLATLNSLYTPNRISGDLQIVTDR